MSKTRYLECAIVINTHGISGDVKLESLCDSPSVLASLDRVYMKEGESYREVRVLRASVFKCFVIARLEGISTIDSAAALKNTVLYACRDDLDIPEGSHFIADLIGLDVIDNTSGKVYGKVCDVLNKGASDIYVVQTADGERMMPAVKEFVKRIDIEKGIYVELIPGMLYD